MRPFVLTRPALRCLLASCIALAAGCSQPSANEPAKPAVIVDDGKLRVPEGSPLRSELVVQAAERREAPRALTTPAMVEANPARTVSVLPPATGRVVDLKVGLGDRVSRGQVLMTIASGDAAQAYTDVGKARDALDLAHKQLERALAVKAAGGQATKDVEAAQSAQTQAQQEFDRASARLNAFGGATGGKSSARAVTVTAPISGSITALSIAPGQFVNDLTATVMTLSNLDQVWVTANVPEDQIGLVVPGQDADVRLSAYPDAVLHGKVQFIDDVLAPDTRRTKVRIAFANPDHKLRPNMFGTATFQLPQAAQVIVPQSALLMNNDSVTVFVETAPWTFERRRVTLGYDEGSDARVTSGLQAGERVVVRNGVLIND